jgi:hypothetical protein
MKRVAIIGAGQAGLLLAIGLQKKGYHVTVFSDQSAEAIATGRVRSSQVQFEHALAFERSLGLNFWDDAAPVLRTVSLAVASPSVGAQKPDIFWAGALDQSAQSVDQRVKFTAYIRRFRELGGTFIVQDVLTDDLRELAPQYDLILLATGKGLLGKALALDTQKTQFSTAQRKLTLIYADNVKPAQNAGVRANIIPGVGEFFTTPGLGLKGPCEMMLFEGVPGGPLDQWPACDVAADYLRHAKNILAKYLPWEGARFKEARITDPLAVLSGDFRPLVRKPILQLQGGQAVLAMGDAVVLNDPIAGQGANNATECARIYYESIVALGEGKPTESWMQKTFDAYWEYAKYPTQWSHMLLQPPTPQMQTVFKVAAESKDLANRLANSFNQVVDLFPWMSSEPFFEKEMQAYRVAKGPGGYFKERLMARNEEYKKRFEDNLIMRVAKEQSDKPEVVDRLLAAIQLFSNFFQKSVLLRHALSEKSPFFAMSHQHLLEELDHNYTLSADRGKKPAAWDPILAGASAWFSWKMLTLDEMEKALLMHCVLEASAFIFTSRGSAVLALSEASQFFSDHAACDDGHEAMGWGAVTIYDEVAFDTVSLVQKEGWDMINLACNRMGEIAVGLTPAAKLEEIIRSSMLQQNKKIYA